MSGVLHGILAGLAGAAKDTFWKYVTLLLPGNGTNGAQNNTFLDASTNNFTITRNGNTTQGTFTPYGANWSNYFSGSGQYLTGPTNNVAFQFGTGDFTVEAWVYSTSFAAYQTLIDVRAADTASAWALFIEQTSGKPYWYDASGTQLSSTGLTLNTWQHLAVARSGSTIKIFIDGTQVFSGTNNNSQNASGALTIGRNYAGTALFTGYISNLRVVKGTAVYTGAFTPSTAPLTAISGTSLLTCQSNRFIDNSSNAFAITATGTPSVQRFSPFSPSAAYAAADIGGSGYFDGNGDYLTIADSANLELGSGNWTIEGWFYVTSGTGDRVLYGRDNNSGADVLIRLSTGSNNLQVYLSSDGTTFGISSTGAISGATVNYNAWNHFAVTSSSGTIRKGINGVMDNIGTLASIVNSTKTWYVGARGNVSEYFPGYISNLRVVIGTAVYAASTYTVPTAPLTAITNTSLLLNFTNAGIIDNAMLNDLETVGNAQISTAQSKFGGSSMYFDETGDYLTVPVSTNISIGTGDFTIECWVRFAVSTVGNGQGVYQLSNGYLNSVVRGPALGCENSVGDWTIYYGTTFTQSGTVPTAGVWYHTALVRSSTTTQLYVDGTSIISVADTTDYTDQYFTIGGWYSTSFLLNGYIDDLRITKGVARYTANFTPPAQAFPTS